MGAKPNEPEKTSKSKYLAFGGLYGFAVILDGSEVAAPRAAAIAQMGSDGPHAVEHRAELVDPGPDGARAILKILGGARR
jgi:hypothetical protein